MNTNKIQNEQITDSIKTLQRIESRIVNMNLRLERTETRLVVLAKKLGHLDAMETSTPPRRQE